MHRLNAVSAISAIAPAGAACRACGRSEQTLPAALGQEVGGVLLSLRSFIRRGAGFLTMGVRLGLVLLLAWGSALAAPVGQVTNLSGPLFAVNKEGVRRVLSVGSQVEPGETLVTEAKTYAQVRFIDKGVVTLRPGTQFRIESFSFEEGAPGQDAAVFGLVKGTLRSVTGLVGKRGNQDAYQMKTATATIGIRGTDYIATYVPEEETAVSRVPFALPLLASLDARWLAPDDATMSDAPPLLLLAQFTPPPANGLDPGLYVQVLDGAINLSNPAGSQTFSAGQFGFSAGFNQPPVVLPQNPGIQFSPPPSFQSTQQQGQQAPPGQFQSTPGSSQQQNQQGEGCEVR